MNLSSLTELGVPPEAVAALQVQQGDHAGALKTMVASALSGVGVPVDIATWPGSILGADALTWDGTDSIPFYSDIAAGGWGDTIDGADLLGLLGWNPFTAAKNLGKKAINAPFDVAKYAAQRAIDVPFALTSYTAHKIAAPFQRRGGGRAPSRPQQDQAAPDAGPPPEAAPPDDGGDQQDTSTSEGLLMGILDDPRYSATARAALVGILDDPRYGATARAALVGHARRHRRRHHGTSGFSLSNLFKHGAATAAVSVVPGGATAIQAHKLASAGLKSGAIKPANLAAAGKLAKAGRAGDTKALVKIAGLKAKAAKGDPNAKKALDHVKIAHAVQTGSSVPGGGQIHAVTAMKSLHSRGLNTIRRH